MPPSPLPRGRLPPCPAAATTGSHGGRRSTRTTCFLGCWRRYSSGRLPASVSPRLTGSWTSAAPPASPSTAFAVADAGYLPFPAESFTAVLSTSALRHFDDPVCAAREMARVLRPGGRMVVADFLACGDDGRRGWDSLRRRRRAPRWDGPPRAVAQAPVVVTEVTRCPTAFGWYATVAAVKPDTPRR
jgi:SAM-dependent methyltransferase